MPPRRLPARSRRARAAGRLLRCLTTALAAAAAGACTVRVGGVPISIPNPTPRRPAPAPSPGGATATRALRAADRYVGVPYRWGGTSPRTGFDCSGFVQYVYGREGVELPRTSRQQAVAGVRRPTRWDAAGPGDLVMFAEPGAAVSHVAFYAGAGRILHASGSGGAVRYDDLGTRRGRWYRERLVAVRRVSGRGPAVARGLLARLGLTNAPLDPPDLAPGPR
jgi:cell wall-associated NlpC family hydrolase